MKKAGAKLTLLRQWRRRRDSNPRYPFGVYTISNRARSTSYATSPCNCPWATGQGCNPKAGQLRPACLVYTTHCKKSRAFFPFFWLTIFCMSLRGAKRWDNPFSCGSAKQNATIPGEYVRRYEFARSSARLPSFSAGKRIAAPVCALVRNDMQKTGACQRMQVGGHEEKCVDGSGFTWYNVLAYADTQQVSACHCEERSDVAIRSPAAAQSKTQLFPANT